MSGRPLTHSFGNVNYEDPNLNISIPCFTIHGNHDDPTGVRSQIPPHRVPCVRRPTLRGVLNPLRRRAPPHRMPTSVRSIC